MRYGKDTYTIKQVAQILECSQMTIYNLRKRGLLKAIHPYGKGCGKPTLFSRQEVESLLEKLSGTAGTIS